MARFSIWFVWKKAYKTIVKNKSKSIPIILLLMFAIAFATVMFDMQDFRNQMVAELVEKTNLADGTAYFNPINLTIAETQLENITDDLDNFEWRMLMAIKFEVLGEEYDGILLGIELDQRERINSLIDENKEEIEDYEFAINTGFADTINLKKGEEITLIHGSIEKKVKVGEFGYNFEFQYQPLHPNIAFPSVLPYPILYVDLKFIQEEIFKVTTPIVNQFLYKFESEDDEKEINDKIEEELDFFSVEIVPKEDQAFIKSMREDEEGDRQMLMMFTVMFIAGAIITLIIVMNKLVEEDLKSISVFQALGANRREIVASYLLFNFVILSIAVIFGMILSLFLSYPLYNLLADVMGLPFSIEPAISFNNTLWVSLILFVAAISSTLLIVKRTFKMDVQQTLKYETKFLEKTNIFEKLYSKRSRNPHPFVKYNLRRIFGRKLHLISLLFALSISASFLLLVFGMNDGFLYSVNRKFYEVEKWDCVASTWNYEDKNNMSLTIDSLSEVNGYEFGIIETLMFSQKDSDFDDYLRLFAYEPNQDMHLLEVERGRLLKEDGEALISKDFFLEYNLKLGDELYIKSINLDESYDVEIVGVVNDMTSMTIFLKLDFAQEILNQTGNINTIYLEADDDIDACAKEVQDLSEIEVVTTLESLRDEIEFMMEYMVLFVLLFGILFFVFGILLITIIFKSIVDYRMEDYSNMKAVGVFNSEIRKSLLLELFMYYVLSFVLGVVIGIIFLTALFEQWTTDMAGLTLYFYPISFVYYTLMFTSILVISYLYNYRRIKRINIADMMRAKTFG